MSAGRSWAEERPGGFLPRWVGPDGRKHSESLVKWAAHTRKDTVRNKAQEIARNALAEAQLLGPRLVDGRSTTLEQVWKEYSTSMATTAWKPKTRDRNLSMYKCHVQPRWGACPVGLVGHGEVQSWVADLVVSGKLRPSSAVKAFHVLSGTLEYAHRGGLLTVNPCRGVKLPVNDADPRRALPPEHIRDIHEALTPHYRPLFITLCETGIREAEAAGLTVCSIDADSGSLRVEGQLLEVGRGELHRDSPKTEAGVRWVPVTKEVAKMLTQLGEGRAPDEQLFTTETGAPIRMSNFRARQWNPANKKVDLDYLIHEIRHTRMTTWAAAGVRPEQIRDWGGYSDIATVYRIYVHGDPKPGSTDITKVPSVFSGDDGWPATRAS